MYCVGSDCRPCNMLHCCMNEHGNNLLLELLQVQEPHQSNGGERPHVHRVHRSADTKIVVATVQQNALICTVHDLRAAIFPR